ncbi:MAG TPA: DUF1499 domain-containing protein [Fimbriiglobus sp.]|nr:DUF1499 domain-containing protein [Fimbriiglobus sp.]
MRPVRWFTRNWANTRDPTHPDLGPLTLPGSLAAAVRRIEAAAGKLPRWHVESADPAAGTVHLTRRTRLWGFVDDVRLTVTPTADGTRVDAESRSRVGVGDLGQNRRNILELWSAIGANPER